jgi:protein TonB
MSNSVLLPPDPPSGNKSPELHRIDNVRLSGDLGEADQGVFTSLVSSIRDVFFPQKLPPLQLESTPIPVVDRMAVKRDPTAAAISTVINVAVVALVLWIATRQVIKAIAPKPPVTISLEEPPPPLKLPPKAQSMGGGGGHPDKLPVAKGNPPKFDKEQLNPPKAPPLEQPKIPVPVTVNVDPNVRMAHVDMPNMGMPNAPTVGTGSLGNGKGTGIGSGDGSGIGPGSGHGIGGGVYRPGGGVSAPVVLYSPEPEFSEEARKAKVAGNVLVYLQVDQTGAPTHVRVLRGIGLGLDEKALDAVRHYKFKPAMKDGKPVTVEMNVEVNFQIF